MRFQIHRDGMALAGQKIMAANKQALKSKPPGIFGYFLGTRTVVNRKHKPGNNSKRKKYGKSTGNTTSDASISDNNGYNQVPPYEISSKLLLL